MDRRRRKYTSPDSEYEIPSRTRRYWKRRKLIEAINVHQSNQEMQKLDQESSDFDFDNGSEDEHYGCGITQNLSQESSDDRAEGDDIDGDDVTQKLDQESSDFDSDNGSEDEHDGCGITNLSQESSDGRAEGDDINGDDVTVSNFNRPISHMNSVSLNL
uniref:uncharacterized protein LOC124066227 isoform X2 n=1 Tax=Scatophagus argus TaxID=75038 RepID=UPI001ED81D56|nr:uncharacterized protein LOC124066227 isoform X2 [Scatophagus argus]